MRNSSFSFRLAEVMGEQNLTQAEVAEQLHVSQTSVSRWLAGSAPRIQKASRLANVLGVDVGWLLTGNGLKHMNEDGNQDHGTEGNTRRRQTNLVGPYLERGRAKFPERLRWLRESFGLSLEDFAAACGYSASYVSRLESASQQDPSSTFPDKLVMTFLVKSDWLLFGFGSPFFVAEEEFYRGKFGFLGDKDPRAFLQQLNKSHSEQATSGLVMLIAKQVKANDLLELITTFLDGRNVESVRPVLADLVKELQHRISVYPQGEETKTVSFDIALSTLETIFGALYVAQTSDSTQGLVNADPKVLSAALRWRRNNAGLYLLPLTELESAVRAGINIESIRVVGELDEAGRRVGPPKELSKTQVEVLRSWAAYWEAKGRGESPPEPSHLSFGYEPHGTRPAVRGDESQQSNREDSSKS